MSVSRQQRSEKAQVVSSESILAPNIPVLVLVLVLVYENKYEYQYQYEYEYEYEHRFAEYDYEAVPPTSVCPALQEFVGTWSSSRRIA